MLNQLFRKVRTRPGAEALAAAFALARQSRSEAEARLDDPKLPEAITKPADGFRIALMLPAEGPAASVSQHIREGAEFALFKLAGKNIDMIFLDSENPDLATAAALANGADMILGPVLPTRRSVSAPSSEKTGCRY